MNISHLIVPHGYPALSPLAGGASLGVPLPPE